MPKFRNKPIQIEAVQFLGQRLPMIEGLADEGHASASCFVTTIHGQRTLVSYGDWIITEPDGEHYYPCKPDIFAARYEPLTENQEGRK